MKQFNDTQIPTSLSHVNLPPPPVSTTFSANQREKPALGTFKVNTNASKGKSNKATIGIIIRNSNGVFIEGRACDILAKSALEVETTACRIGL